MVGRKDLISLDLEVEGFEPYKASLSLYITRFTDLRALWPGIAADIGAENKKQIDSQGRHGSTPYEELSPPYAAWKASQVGPKPILIFSGDMFDTLTNPSSSGFVTITRKLDMTIIFRSPYARYHQRGTKKMPARPPMILRRVQGRKYMQAIQEFVFKAPGQSQRRVIL